MSNDESLEELIEVELIAYGIYRSSEPSKKEIKREGVFRLRELERREERGFGVIREILLVEEEYFST